MLLVAGPLMLYGQDFDGDPMMQKVDTAGNPVYKPVISLSYGMMTFRGDVQNSLVNPVMGNSALSLSLSTSVDRKRYYSVNFFFMLGSLGANAYSHNDIAQNLNFRTDISTIGANLEYRFGHFINNEALIRPYVSAGVGILGFSSKGDHLDANGSTYYYWTDGSIRDSPEWLGAGALPLYRDYEYETDLRLYEKEEYGLGDYNEKSVVLPLGVGAHFRINNRAFFSLGMTYHYAITDMIDNVAHEGTHIQGSKGNDGFIFSHLTLHYDLFSGKAAKQADPIYAYGEVDPLLFDDEDGDFVMDVTDRCPGTPFGIEVDTLGCPLDGDRDGIADYLDEELDTKRDAWVDEVGVTLSEEAFLTAMQQRENAMDRVDVEAYMAISRGEYRLASEGEIPEKFRPLDVNNDGYLSFDELLQVIDNYFDYQLELDVVEVRQLNDFFFSQ